MKKIIPFVITLIILGSHKSLAQNFNAVPKTNPVTAKKLIGIDLLIPLEIDFVNVTPANATSMISILIDNTTAPVISQFGSLAGISIVSNNQNVTVNNGATGQAPNKFYLRIDKNVVVTNEKILYLKVQESGVTITSIKVIIQPDDTPISLSAYKADMLGYVTKVESTNNVLTISGFKKINAHDNTKHDVFVKKTVELKRGEVFSVTEGSWILNSGHWSPVPIALTTIPFKIRPKLIWDGKEYGVTSTSGITNIGFNLDLAKCQIDRYFSQGKKSSHKFSIGFFAAPSVEELDSLYTNGGGGKLGKLPGKMEKSKQLFISTGLTLSYSYNDISFVITPVGKDFSTSTLGEYWFYKKRRWWGFGIAVSPKIFSTIFNK